MVGTNWLSGKPGRDRNLHSKVDTCLASIPFLSGNKKQAFFFKAATPLYYQSCQVIPSHLQGKSHGFMSRQQSLSSIIVFNSKKTQCSQSMKHWEAFAQTCRKENFSLPLRAMEGEPSIPGWLCERIWSLELSQSRCYQERRDWSLRTMLIQMT